MDKILLETREGRLLTDFEIISDNKKDEITAFPAHKLLLMLQSVYFHTFFTSPLNENRSSMIIQNGTPHSVDIFLNFFYTSNWDLVNLRPDLQTMKEVIILAPQYLVYPLLDIITTHISKIASPINGIEILEFSAIYKNDPCNMNQL